MSEDEIRIKTAARIAVEAKAKIDDLRKTQGSDVWRTGAKLTTISILIDSIIEALTGGTE